VHHHSSACGRRRACLISVPCSRSSAWTGDVPDSVEIAPLATDGSVASASIRICG
jgi:hypothetical protein